MVTILGAKGDISAAGVEMTSAMRPRMCRRPSRAWARAFSSVFFAGVPALVAVILAQTMSLSGLAEAQASYWYVVIAPLAMLLFFTSSQAEIGRAPFDLLEAESELVAGYQTEYSGLKFGMFYVGEFLHAFTVSALTVTLFFGAWQGPWAEQVPLLGIVWFLLKTFVVYFFVIVLRISMPRLRIDHLLNFNWKFLTPVALVLLMATAVLEKLLLDADASIGIRLAAHLALNVLIAWGTVEILRRYSRSERKKVGEPRPVVMAPKSAPKA